MEREHSQSLETIVHGMGDVSQTFVGSTISLSESS